MDAKNQNKDHVYFDNEHMRNQSPTNYKQYYNNDPWNNRKQNEKYDIEIYTLTGQRLYQAFGTSNIDMTSFSSGIYLIKISDQNSTTTKRVIKVQ